MNQFVNAVIKTPILARTENGMKAQESSMSAVVDLFYQAGVSRGKDITGLFERAFQENKDLTIRIAQWIRDIRGGAGERQLFKDILLHLEKYHPEILLNSKLLDKIPEIGRWDDLLIFTDPKIKAKAYDKIYIALNNNNALAAKWMPRKGKIAAELRSVMRCSPKAYRKTLVNLTNVVETAMCSNEYENINYSHVPSLAMSRYMKTFHAKDAERFTSYREALKRGSKNVKVNAGAVYPYDIIKSLKAGGNIIVNDKQWDSLPNYMSDANVLPMVDVSGSMLCSAGGSSVTCLDVALSLGLYCADKNKGPFKDLFLTFSAKPQLIKLKGTLSEKIIQLDKSDWEMNTNLHAAFDRILDVATINSVKCEDMPSVVLVLSDMQFDECSKYDDSAIQMISRKYESAGYKLPMIVFWNLSVSNNTPVSSDKNGVALVSGFSPAIMKSVLAADIDSFSPENIVISTLKIDRYDWT